MSAISKIAVIIIFAIALYSVSNLAPQIQDDNIQGLVESRLFEVQSELESKTEEVISLKRVLDLKDKQNKENKDQIKTQQETITDKEVKIAKINNEITEIQDKTKKKIEELENKVTELSKRPDSKDTGYMINGRFLKKYFGKQTPEYQRITYVANDVDSDFNDLIVMTSIAHSGSYGKERQFSDFLKVVEDIEFDKTNSTLGLLIGTKEEFKIVQEYIETIERTNFFSKIVLIQSEFIESLHKMDRELRHKAHMQKERRRAISRARNFLLTNSLGDETYTLCLDSDMIEIPRDTLNLFLKSGKDIIAPRIRQGGAENYDFNSWSGRRKEPTAEEEDQLDKNPEFVFIPRPDGSAAAHMHDFVNDPQWGNTGEVDFLTPLDSVGGAVLFVKSEVFQQGVMFPPYYAVGTKWGRNEGYDGIETEGLCYQAKTIGYECWGMPNLVAWHIEDIEK